MVFRGIANSRMKDFYDLWVLATTYPYEARILHDAITATFERRATPIPKETPLALTNEFADDSSKKAQWAAFLKKGKLLPPEALALSMVTNLLEKLIVPTIKKNSDKKALERSWAPERLEWIKRANSWTTI